MLRVVVTICRLTRRITHSEDSMLCRIPTGQCLFLPAHVTRYFDMLILTALAAELQTMVTYYHRVRAPVMSFMYQARANTTGISPQLTLLLANTYSYTRHEQHIMSLYQTVVAPLIVSTKRKTWQVDVAPAFVRLRVHMVNAESF